MRYDNDVGKDDHRHFGDKESVYAFETPDTLVADFQRDIARWAVKTVILDVRDPGETMKGFVRVWKTGKPEKSARISFASPEFFWKVLTAKRWEEFRRAGAPQPLPTWESGR